MFELQSTVHHIANPIGGSVAGCSLGRSSIDSLQMLKVVCRASKYLLYFCDGLMNFLAAFFSLHASLWVVSETNRDSANRYSHQSSGKQFCQVTVNSEAKESSNNRALSHSRQVLKLGDLCTPFKNPYVFGQFWVGILQTGEYQNFELETSTLKQFGSV